MSEMGDWNIKLLEENKKLRAALENLVDLIEHEVDYKNFENGVLAPGGIDEGMVRSMEIIEKAKAALKGAERK